jgi:hypothetical protein
MPTSLAAERTKRTGLEVSVVKRKDEPGVWTVEAIDMSGDGDIYQAFFAGPDAHERALEYARFKYGAQ